MKHLIIIIAGVTSLVAFAVHAERPKCGNVKPAVVTDEASGVAAKVSRAQWKAMTPEERTAAKRKAKAEKATSREKSDAKRYGYSLEDWCAMTKKARTEVRQQARARALGLTVEQMKAEDNRKQAEKAGCPLEQWSAMTVKERIAYRKQAKAKGNGVSLGS